MGTSLVLIFTTMTMNFGLPPGLLSAVCYVESGHTITAHNPKDGGSPSSGVCQVKLNTARLVGFKGTEKDLMDPVLNAFYAGKYLKKQLTRYNGETEKAIAAYNAGKHRVNKEGLTMNRKYVNKVVTAWEAGK